jgi:Tol biopolymer transport system component
VSLSPDRTRVVWNQACETCFPIETRVTNVMLASLSRSLGAGQSESVTNARKLISLTRAGGTTWIDDQHLLMSARLDRGSEVITAFVYSLADGTTRELVKSDRLRGLSPSRGGEWLAYTIQFDQNAAQNGIWVTRADGSATPRKLDFFGAFQWRDTHRLIYVPVEWNVASHILYEYDVKTGAQRQLTDPQSQPFKIANGDWSVSPDGNQIVFVNAKDQNLWLWSFGEPVQ